MIVSRPALPHCPGIGRIKAAKLKGWPGAPSFAARPVAVARLAPVMPVPVVVERMPPATGVRGKPLPTLMELVKVQSFSTAPFQPLTSVPPRRPTPVEYCQLKLATWVRLLAETARSADVLVKSCAGVPTAPAVPTSSMDLEKV